MQSRYYNPEIGRFINADNQLSAGSDLTGTNMFAYCGNNPISRIDSTGRSWKSFWGKVKNWIVEKKENAAQKKKGTRTLGATASGAFGPAAAVSGGVAFDKKGNVGLVGTVNAGGGFPSASVGFFSSDTNAPSINHLQGHGSTTGASVGPGIVAIGGEYNLLIDSENNAVYHGGTASITAGLFPTFAEVHGEYGYTWVLNLFNVYDLAIIIVDFMGGE